MGVLQDVLVDPELRRHLILNATRMNSYAEKKNEVEAALDAPDDMDAEGGVGHRLWQGLENWFDADPMHVSGPEFGRGGTAGKAKACTNKEHVKAKGALTRLR